MTGGMQARAFRLGLTGSIGMGKSTTAAAFADLGIPVWDADAAVHRLYSADGAAVPAVLALYPAAVGPAGVDRAALKSWIAAVPAALSRLEAVVHPLVAADRSAFLAAADRARAPLVVLDIPLLFETGADATMDATLVVTAPPQVQRARVLARPGMTEAQLDLILSRQMPDRDKRARADHIVETLSHDSVAAYVRALVDHISRQMRGRHA